jgi:cytochrome P450
VHTPASTPEPVAPAAPSPTPSSGSEPRPGNEPPATPTPLVVRIWRGLRDPLGFLTDLERRFGDIVTLRSGRSYAVFHPDYVKHVLQDHHANYEKGEKYRAALTPLMGNGLFTSEGAFWLRQRRIAQGAFQRTQLPAFGEHIIASVSDTVPRWEQKARAGEPVALREEITELTLRATLRMLFGVDAQAHMPALVAAVHEVNDEIRFGRTFLPVHLPEWVPTPGRRRFSRSLRVIDDFVYRIIAQRLAAEDPGTDLVGLLIRARDPETGERMDDRQLRDEVVTMLNAGHDTVTDAVVWSLVLLASNPEARERARAEVLQAAGPAWPTAASLNAMEFLGRAFRETLRLYPPAWGFARSALNADTIGGYTIPAGGLVIVSPYVMHRSPRLWDRPEVFDPDRFLPAASAARPKFAYFPFGSGPRMCIGAGLAAMEAPLIVAALLQRFDFTLPPGTAVGVSPRLSLRPKGTVPLQLRLLDR